MRKLLIIFTFLFCVNSFASYSPIDFSLTRINAVFDEIKEFIIEGNNSPWLFYNIVKMEDISSSLIAITVEDMEGSTIKFEFSVTEDKCGLSSCPWTAKLK